MSTCSFQQKKHSIQQGLYINCKHQSSHAASKNKHNLKSAFKSQEVYIPFNIYANLLHNASK